MKRLIVVPIAAVALALTTTAGAKGPSLATIAGPGLLSPLTISGIGEGDTSTDLGLLVADGGFFPQAFGQSPSPLLRQQPRDLGPRFTVTYTVPGGVTESTLRQELFPYAANAPVTYMQPGQPFWETQRTLGGWYRGTPQLKRMLLRTGLPLVAAAAAPSRPLLQIGRNIFIG